MRHPYVLAFLAFFTAGELSAQMKTVTVEGDRFAIDGQPKFLLFVSYFDAMRLAGRDGELAADLDYLVRLGYDGIRILPNWKNYCAPKGSREEFPGDGLFTTGQGIQESKWPVFKGILDLAAQKGLLVDVSFTSETINGAWLDRPGGPTLDSYRAQIVEVARRLRADAAGGGYRHVLFDLQNEFDNNGVSLEHIESIASAVRGVDPSRLITASTSGGSHSRAGEAANRAALDFAAVHPDRSSANWWESKTLGRAIDEARSAMAEPHRPVHLQEPVPFSFACGDAGQDHDSDIERHALAAGRARQYGAAAWTFHTRTTFNLAVASYEKKISGASEASALAAVVKAVNGKSASGATSDSLVISRVISE